MSNRDFIQQVNTLSEQTVELCYHCHKCTAGCPVMVEMEYGPDRVLRLIQLGEKERVLISGDIWVCASCETCGTRCPNEINIAEVMDALRAIALTEGYPAAEPNAPAFHALFNGIVGQLGRMHETSLMALFMLKTWSLWGDVIPGIQLFLKGKIPLLPHRVDAVKDVKRIYRETGS